MFQERSSWDAHWKDLVKNFSPRKGRFLASDRNRGGKRNTLINNTPLFAKRVLRAGLMAGVTSPARPWFRLSPADPGMRTYKRAREWFDQVEKLMYRIFSASNLYQQLPNIYDDLSVAGTAALFTQTDYQTMAHFSALPLGEYALDINGHNRVDTFAREYEMSVYQVVSIFGLKNTSAQTQRAYERAEYSSPVRVRHWIEPTTNISSQVGDLGLPEEMKYGSIYYEHGQSHNLLRVEGFRDFPVMAPRWDVQAGDIYGYSAGMDALGDAKALQVQEREKGKAVAKMVSPPTKAPASLKTANVSLLPGANTFIDDPQDVFTPIYQVSPQVTQLAHDIQRTEERINRSFYVDLFLMMSRQDDVRTATEVAVREEEKLLQLGPVLESLHNELLDPLIDRTFNILIEEALRGWQGFVPQILPAPPPELLGSELRVEYISILAQAQRMVAAQVMDRWVGFTERVGQSAPEVMDLVDADALVGEMGDALGVPAKVLRGAEQVQEIRRARAEQAQQAQMQQMAEAAVPMAKELSTTDTDSQNALTDLMAAADAAQT